MQPLPDLSLLPALDALLDECSVTRAAERLSVTPPAISRTLGRLRRQLGDELLVPSGRGLQATPFAEALRPRVRAALDAAVAALTPVGTDDLTQFTGVHSVRTAESVVTTLMPDLHLRTRAEVPGLELRIVPEGDEDPADLRRDVDLDIGVLPRLPPDIRSEHLVTDHVVLAVRAGHPLTRGRVTPRRLAAAEQIVISRRGRSRGAIDDRLADLGLRRRVTMVTTSHVSAASVAAVSDTVAVLSRRLATRLAQRYDLRLLTVPLELPGIPIAMAWHSRLDNDPAARWVRGAVRDLLAP